MRRTITRLCGALVALGALAGLYGAWKRYQAEGLNRRVEMALEIADAQTLADVTGQPLQAVLARFRAAGVTSLAITEDTISSLETQGALRAERRNGHTVVTVASRSLLERIQRAWAAKGLLPAAEAGHGPDHGTTFQAALPERAGALQGRLSLPADYTTLRPLGIGLDPEAVQVARRAGLFPVGRISNFPGASSRTMTNVLHDLKRLGVQTVIFQGTEVLGFRGQPKEAADALRAAQLTYGQIEFGKQKGDAALSVALQGEYVRVHSISEGEMETLDEREAVDRFVRAARERNIRLCYIHPLTLAGDDPVGVNAAYVEKIARGIARGGEMAFGAARTFRETGVPVWAFGLMAVGVAAGLTLLLLRLAPVSDTTAGLTLAGLLLVCVGAAVGLGETGRKGVALLAALAFPTLACLRRDVLEGAGEQGSKNIPTSPPPHTLTRYHSMRSALLGLLAASAITSLGVLHVVGLLATRPFMLKANQFLGIKAAHAIPLLLIGALALVGLPRLERAWAEERARLRGCAARLFDEPVRIGLLLMALVGLVALALVVARTGNEPGVGVSGLELKFRALLDRLLPVRPRTKEFLVGHPAFVLGLALWFRGRRRWARPLFVVGVIGQVSLLNTFCHIHTPLTLSLIRALTGLVLGALLGLAAFGLVERMRREA